MDLHEQIKIARERIGLTPEALADKVGVSKQAVLYWESGANVPRLPKLIKLEEALKVTLRVTGSTPAETASGLHLMPLDIKRAIAISKLPKASLKLLDDLLDILSPPLTAKPMYIKVRLPPLTSSRAGNEGSAPEQVNDTRKAISHSSRRKG